MKATLMLPVLLWSDGTFHLSSGSGDDGFLHRQALFEKTSPHERHVCAHLLQTSANICKMLLMTRLKVTEGVGGIRRGWKHDLFDPVWCLIGRKQLQRWFCPRWRFFVRLHEGGMKSALLTFNSYFGGFPNHAKLQLTDNMLSQIRSKCSCCCFAFLSTVSFSFSLSLSPRCSTAGQTWACTWVCTWARTGSCFAFWEVLSRPLWELALNGARIRGQRRAGLHTAPQWWMTLLRTGLAHWQLLSMLSAGTASSMLTNLTCLTLGKMEKWDEKKNLLLNATVTLVLL